MNIVFAGIFPFSTAHLDLLLASNLFHVRFLLVSKKRPQLSEAIARKYANSGSLVALQSQDELLKKLQSNKRLLTNAWLVSAGFPEKISQPIVDIFEGRTVNVHPSLLPRHRGPDPIRRSILNGEKDFGYSLHSLTEQFDVGGIYRQWHSSFPEDLITEEILRQLGHQSARGLVELLGEERPGFWNSVEEVDWALFPYEGAVLPAELEISDEDALKVVSQKIRAVGLAGRVGIRFADGTISEFQTPRCASTNHSVVLPVAGRRIEVIWSSGGRVRIAA